MKSAKLRKAARKTAPVRRYEENKLFSGLDSVAGL